MALVHSTAARNAAANAVLALLNGGSLELQTAGNAEVATCALQATAAAAASSGIAAINDPTPDASATGNASPVTKAVFKSSAAATVLTCAVASSGSDINLSSTTIGTGDTVTITGLTYTAQP